MVRWLDLLVLLFMGAIDVLHYHYWTYQVLELGTIYAHTLSVDGLEISAVDRVCWTWIPWIRS